MSPVNKSRARPSRILLAVLFIFLAASSVRCQTAPAPDTSLLPGCKPPDVPLEWKQLVGIYKHEGTKETFILLEQSHRLFWQSSDHGSEEALEENGTLWVAAGGGRSIGLKELRDAGGNATGLSYLKEVYTRTDGGCDPAHFYYVTPTHPLDQLRAAALAAQPPAEPGPFRQADLVELITLEPAFHLDIRYAKSNNFLSTPIYSQARAFLQKPAAEALLRALHKLQPLGYGLLIHDAYRPWYVTKIFWDATPAEGHIFVADANKGSRHNRGCAVDLTLYYLVTSLPVEMPGLYDEMSSRSFPNFPGGTSLQRWHRDLLRHVMESEGFAVNEDEWWHFDFKEWKQYGILNIPFENLSVSPPRP
jgi:D-alanyl-D-alanine dipeptidase